MSLNAIVIGKLSLFARNQTMLNEYDVKKRCLQDKQHLIELNRYDCWIKKKKISQVWTFIDFRTDVRCVDLRIDFGYHACRFVCFFT